jgi:hypothetical protein
MNKWRVDWCADRERPWFLWHKGVCNNPVLKDKNNRVVWFASREAAERAAKKLNEGNPCT